MPEEGTGDVSQEVEHLKSTLSGVQKGMLVEREKRQAAELEAAELRGKLDSRPAEAKPEYTRAQLAGLVDEGRLNQAQADALMDEQIERKVTEKVTATTADVIDGRTRDHHAQTDIDKYKDAIPDLMDDGSEARAAIQEEIAFQKQFTSGRITLETELMALRALYGPAGRLKKGHKVDPETHQGTGNDGDEDDPKRGVKDLGLTERELAYANKQIGRGLYKDLEQYAAEVKAHGNQELRQRRS